MLNPQWNSARSIEASAIIKIDCRGDGDDAPGEHHEAHLHGEGEELPEAVAPVADALEEGRPRDGHAEGDHEQREDPSDRERTRNPALGPVVERDRRSGERSEEVHARGDSTPSPAWGPPAGGVQCAMVLDGPAATAGRPSLPPIDTYLRAVIALGFASLRLAIPALGFLYFYRLGMGLYLALSTDSSSP